MSKLAYIETTIASYLTARPARDLIMAARQQITAVWWERERPRYACRISQIVLDEARRGDAKAAKRRVEALEGITLLDLNEDVDDLAETLIRRRVLPANAVEDAAHIAVATIHRVEYLVTWNFRHIANATKMNALRGVCAEMGYVLPVICTPEELMRGQL